MNVYDFDGTIYAGDSSRDFYLYCIAHQPSLLRYFPRQARAIIGYLSSQISSVRKPSHARPDKTSFKESFYSYLPHVRNLPGIVDRFWAGHKRKIYPWYYLQKQHDDVIISASARFLLEPICAELGVRLIASDVNPSTGLCTRLNCGGSQKPSFFLEIFSANDIDSFYSDSDDDLPMAAIAPRAYKVRGGKVYDWNIRG
jgi:phosphoserine phosphatase